MNENNQVTNDLLTEYLQYIQTNKSIGKSSTGFNNLDNLLNGGISNGLVTLGAIPSLGKTTFTLQLANNFCNNEDTKVLFFL